MRRLVTLALLAAAIVFAATACGPKVQTTPLSYDEDLGDKPTPVELASEPVADHRPVAPIGQGVRTGRISRAQLEAVLAAGPGAFLRQLEVTPKLDADRFVGWTLVQVLDRTSGLATLDLQPGDVLLSVNGTAISRPDQLQTVWDSLHTATAVTAELWRGTARFEIAFTVEPTQTSMATP